MTASRMSELEGVACQNSVYDLRSLGHVMLGRDVHTFLAHWKVRPRPVTGCNYYLVDG
jgi:hypothetical protein